MERPMLYKGGNTLRGQSFCRTQGRVVETTRSHFTTFNRVANVRGAFDGAVGINYASSPKHLPMKYR